MALSSCNSFHLVAHKTPTDLVLEANVRTLNISDPLICSIFKLSSFSTRFCDKIIEDPHVFQPKLSAVKDGSYNFIIFRKLLNWKSRYIEGSAVLPQHSLIPRLASFNINPIRFVSFEPLRWYCSKKLDNGSIII